MEIEKNIPFPNPPGPGRPALKRAVLEAMQVGDSVLYGQNEKTARVTASSIGRKLGRRYSCAQTAEGWRIWRTA